MTERQFDKDDRLKAELVAWIRGRAPNWLPVIGECWAFTFTTPQRDIILAALTNDDDQTRGGTAIRGSLILGPRSEGEIPSPATNAVPELMARLEIYAEALDSARLCKNSTNPLAKQIAQELLRLAESRTINAAPTRVAGQTTVLPDEPGNPEPGGSVAAPSKGPTPRTDAVATHLNLSHGDTRMAARNLLALARQLERELAAQKEWSDGEITRMGYQLDELNAALSKRHQLERELADARAVNRAHEAVRDACFEALPECHAWGDVPGHIAELKAVRSTGEAASEDVQRFAIQVEKSMLAAMGRAWTPTGISIGTLIFDLIAFGAAKSAASTRPLCQFKLPLAIREIPLDDINSLTLVVDVDGLTVSKDDLVRYINSTATASATQPREGEKQ